MKTGNGESAKEIVKFWRSVKSHAGSPIAAALMLMGFAAGAKGDNWFGRGLVGAGIMCIFWVPVLLTAWEMRHDRKHDPSRH